MDTHDLIPAENGGMSIPAAQMMDALRVMADMLRSTNERMAALENEVRRLTKVTPAQANELNAAMRRRAAEICEKRRLPGCEKETLRAIRRAVRETCAISGARDLPRCDYKIAMMRVEMWDDFKVIREIREKTTMDQNQRE